MQRIGIIKKNDGNNSVSAQDERHQQSSADGSGARKSPGSKSPGQYSRKEAFSLTLAFLGNQQSGVRARTGVCSHVSGASSKGRAVGGCERSMEEAGLGYYVVEESPRTCGCVFVEMEDQVYNLPNLQVLKVNGERWKDVQ